MSGDCLIVIPARYGSTRFPGKVLAPLKGRPVLEWCYRSAKAADLGPVLIATEDERVRAAARRFGAQSVLTPKSCASGTDRVFAAAKNRKEPYVINLQADQPLIRPQTLRRVASLLRAKRAEMATAVIPLENPARVRDPNVVKVALAAHFPMERGTAGLRSGGQAALAEGGRCLYFSRAPIPFSRNGRKAAFYEHLGIYGFARRTLRRFVKLPPSDLEKTESLEQLRALEDGISIFAAVVSDLPLAIDTPADLRRARRWLTAKTSRRHS